MTEQYSILFLDLDGTIRKPKSDNRFISDPYDQELIVGAVSKLKEMNSILKIGITNQGGVLAGHKTLEDCIKEQAYTMELMRLNDVELDFVYFCPDEGQTCYKVKNEKSYKMQGRLFRKPDPGMINLALEIYGFVAASCKLIGDRPEDETAAKLAGVPFEWAKDWWTKPAPIIP